MTSQEKGISWKVYHSDNRNNKNYLKFKPQKQLLTLISNNDITQNWKCKRGANLKESSLYVVINSTFFIYEALRKPGVSKHRHYTSTAAKRACWWAGTPETLLWNPCFPAHTAVGSLRAAGEIWSDSRSSRPCSRTTDDPKWLEVSKLQPEATMLWTLAHSELTPAGLLPLALIL